MEDKVSKRQGGEGGWEDLTLQCFAGLFQTNPLTEDLKKKTGLGLLFSYSELPSPRVLEEFSRQKEVQRSTRDLAMFFYQKKKTTF